MLLRLAMATQGFVSSYEEEEYELSKVFSQIPDNELDEDDEVNNETNQHRRENIIPGYPEQDKEIFDDDTAIIKELF